VTKAAFAVQNQQGMGGQMNNPMTSQPMSMNAPGNMMPTSMPMSQAQAGFPGNSQGNK
jgi:hypothetical protein